MEEVLEWHDKILIAKKMALLFCYGGDMEPEKGKYGLWYAGTVGFATKEQAQEYIDSSGKSRPENVIETKAQKGANGAHIHVAGESTSTIVWLLVAAIALVAFVGWFFLSMRDGEGSGSRVAASALTRCQQAILSTAKYGDAESPPYRTPELTKSSALYVWEVGSFHFKNGFGVKVPQSAKCLATKDEIIYLEMNGEVLIDR